MEFSRRDFTEIFSDDVELTDVRYSEPFIYKYYYFPDPEALLTFVAKPTIKFAHRDDLNDPFELSKRWARFGCPLTEAIFDKYVRPRFEDQIGDIGLVTRKFRERAAQNGVFLSRQQTRRWLSSREGQFEIATVRQAGLEHMAEMAKLLPQMFQENEGDFVDSFIRETGILSLTEDPNSSDMWRDYAGDGRGFVFEFDAQHEFFLLAADDGKKRKLLRQVFYRDDRIEDFWKNPHYLFLVKESKWAFEKEWRMIKSLEECQKIVRAVGRPLYLIDMPTGLIKSITFGRNFSSGLISEVTSSLHEFDNSITIRS